MPKPFQRVLIEPIPVASLARSSVLPRRPTTVRPEWSLRELALPGPTQGIRLRFVAKDQVRVVSPQTPNGSPASSRTREATVAAGQPSRQLVFRPRARLVSVLGEHLISDAAVGLIELVKNSYDADATDVVVELLRPTDAQTGSVVVLDNGVGMTFEDIRDKWLSPAVDHKEQDKARGKRTPLGRLPIGEKGVGRFAVHQLGRRLHLVTRADQAREVVLDVDWDSFDATEAFLDDLKVLAVEREPETFRGEATGTRLEISRLRSPLSENLLKKVHRTLRRLQNPLESSAHFRTRLVCPDMPELEDIDPTEILERAHYEFRALVEPDGSCDYSYVCRHPGLSGREKSGTESLLPLMQKDLKNRQLECGSFLLNLYVWDRSFLQTSGVSRQELDAYCGVSLFRDNLRVLPYGEPGDDWLLLDQERIQAPADRIGNNQVIGLVLVDQSTNLQLRDKTNREGLIENQAFHDLRGLVRAAVRLFTTHWKHDRPETLARRPSSQAGGIDNARALVSAIGETASDEIMVRRPTRPAPVAEPPLPPSELVTITQREAVVELSSELDGASASIRHEAAERDVLRQLSATGLAAERVVHEFARQVSAAMTHLEHLETTVRRLPAAVAAARAVGTCLRTLKGEFRVLAPYERVGRNEKLQRVSITDVVNLAFLLNQNRLEANGVQTLLIGEDFTVQSRPTPLVQILDNLVHNANYWVCQSQSGVRTIAVVLEPRDRRAIVTDTGPGVHPEMVDHLFEPFSTLKVDGTGLGLYISHQLADSLGCSLHLASAAQRPEGYVGAAFVLEWPGTNEGEETR
jgi:signal transduction histidine kinase